MTPQSLMKRRVNTAFLIMCLTLAVQSIVSLPATVFTVLAQFGIDVPSYYTDFVLLQFLYPIGNCIMALIALKCIRIPLRSVVTVKPVKADFIPWLGVFLGVTVGMNYAVAGLMNLLDWIGIHIPDVFASYDPVDVPQAICYFVVLAVLPSVAEEILCRASVGGLLKHFHPWTAVIVSAYAFGLMHATVQQIPFAFVLGLVLGFVYVKTGNLLYPILFHFINNAWACVLTYLSVWGGEEVLNWFSYGSDLVFLLYGIASVIYLVRKKQFTLREIPHSLSAAEARGALVKAPLFWVFTGLYSGMTVLNAAALALQETMGSSL